MVNPHVVAQPPFYSHTHVPEYVEQQADYEADDQQSEEEEVSQQLQLSEEAIEFLVRSEKRRLQKLRDRALEKANEQVL